MIPNSNSPWRHGSWLVVLLWCSSLAAQTSFTIRNTRPGGNFLWSIASGPTGLVAVGDGGTILCSTDGTAWVRRNSGVTDWLVGVTYGAGQYVAVGDHGRVLASTDGVTWTAVPQTATTARLNNVVYGKGQFVAVGEAGTILSSPDARVWTLRASGVGTWLRGLVYLSRRNEGWDYDPGFFDYGRFFAGGQNGVLLESSDGITWAKPPSIEAVLTTDIEALSSYASATFCAISQDGNVASDRFLPITQPDINHKYHYAAVYGADLSSVGINAHFRGLAQGADAVFATGENGLIASGSDPRNVWTRIESGTTANLVGGLYVGNSLFVIGESETILQSTPLYRSRLMNLSARGQVGTGGNILISGLAITGTAPKTVLVRAAGPALAGFGATGALAAPVLTVLDSAGRMVANNAGWGRNPDPAAIATAAAQVGAFAFPAGSADSAVLVSLPVGNYTTQIAGANNTTGIALVEAYDVDALSSDSSRALNLSTRGAIGVGADVLIAGFNVAGAASRRLLIRAVGPSLAAFGVSSPLADPVLELYRDGVSGPIFTTRAPWSVVQNEPPEEFYAGIFVGYKALLQINADDIRTAALMSGAFALNEGSKDTAVVATLSPGNYTAVVRSASNTTGIALVEVYDLP